MYTPILTIFSLLQQEMYMTHENNITPATSPLLCNHLPSKTQHCC